MHQHRTVHLASSVLTSLACLFLAGCSVGVQSGHTPAKAPTHEQHSARHTDSSTKTPPAKKTKKHDEKSTKPSTTTETAKEVPPATTQNDDTPNKTTDKSPTETPLKGGMSRLVVPVNVSFKAVKEKLEEDLPRTESRQWKRVGKKGKKYEVDVRYEVWRDPISLTMHGDTLRVVVPVRYASDFRAKADKPVGKGSFWLTHGETWGTKEHPQHMDVTIDVSLSVSDDYTLISRSKLVSIEHGAPPTGDACGRVGIEICVPKKELASYVEDEMNDHLGKKIERALKKGDNKVGKLFDLRKHVSTLWSSLATPIELQKPKQVNCPTVVGEACSSSAWLAFEPNALGLSPLELKGDNLGVRVELQGKLSVSAAKPAKTAPELPKLTPTTGGTTFELATTFDIPLAQVTAQLQKALAATPIHFGSTSLKLKSASISVTDGAQKGVSLEIITEKDHKLGFDTKLDYDVKKKLFRLSTLVPNSATKALLENELKELDLVEIQKSVNEHATVALDKASEALRRAIANALSTALPGKLRVKGTLSDFALDDFSLSEKAITAKVVVKGSRGVEFKP
jgi:hypothetical protein